MTKERSLKQTVRQIFVSLLTALTLGALPQGCSSSSDSDSEQPLRAAGSGAMAVPFVFRDADATNGIVFRYRSGRARGHNTILESLGGGVAVLDVEGDGDQDVFLPGGGDISEHSVSGFPGALFVNDGTGNFTDRTSVAEAEASDLYSHGCATTDFDNDGFTDLLVTGFGAPQLFHNQGDGTFLRAAPDAGISDQGWSTSAGWGDLNADGCPDLYLCHYLDWNMERHVVCESANGQPDVCPPRRFPDSSDVLFLSRADGTFQRTDSANGLVAGGKGLGVVLFDCDRDSDVDIYVANDTTENFLYLNDGRGQFSEQGMLSGVAVDQAGMSNGSMGLAVTDFDQDGQPDLWVTNFQDEDFALYRNVGQSQFRPLSRESGVADLGESLVGFGTVAVDLDFDGDEDLVVSNGHILYHPAVGTFEQPVLIMRRHEGGFVREHTVQGSAYMATAHAGRGLAAADLNGDQRPDLVFSPVDAAATFVMNGCESTSFVGRIQLVGTKSARDPVGAVVDIQSALGPQTKFVCGGGSYLSAGEKTLTVALSEQDSAEITVHWPGSAPQKFMITHGHQILIEGRTRGERIPQKKTAAR
ncbi:MAG: CRTAC1 family protein [Planctomycetaceae bacterium]|nr:CRTAC1 family protein [Planctomycetaceae bacterium]